MQIYPLATEIQVAAGSTDRSDRFVAGTVDVQPSVETSSYSIRDRRLAILLCLITTLIGFAIGGCSDDSAAKEIILKRDCLSELASQYQRFQTEHGKSPKDVIEFATFIQAGIPPQETPASEQSASHERKVVDEAVKRLSSGDMMMLYDAVLFTDPAVDPAAILGFEATVASSGGYVVNVEGVASHQTAKAFAMHPMVATVQQDVAR